MGLLQRHRRCILFVSLTNIPSNKTWRLHEAYMYFSGIIMLVLDRVLEIWMSVPQLGPRLVSPAARLLVRVRF